MIESGIWNHVRLPPLGEREGEDSGFVIRSIGEVIVGVTGSQL